METIDDVAKNLTKINDIFTFGYFQSILGNDVDFKTLLKGKSLLMATKLLDEYNEKKLFELTNFKNRINHQEIIEDYNYILNEYSKLAQSLGITDAMELCIFAQNLFDNGYLSFNKEVNFVNDADLKDTYGQFLLMSGKGVCHNHTAFLYDFLRKNGIYAELNIGYLHKEDEKQPRGIRENHAATLVKDNEFIYLYDLTNDTIHYKYDYKEFATLNTVHFYNEQNNHNIKPIKDLEYNKLLKKYFETKKRITKLFFDNIGEVEECYIDVYDHINNINEYILKREVK